MYDDPKLPYKCPKCFQVVSPCTWNASGKLRTCGCFSCNCDAPIFEQKIGESEYTPMIEQNNWVIAYRNKHSDYHKDYLCKDCLRDRNNCKYYDEEMINCPNAEYPREEE